MGLVVLDMSVLLLGCCPEHVLAITVPSWFVHAPKHVGVLNTINHAVHSACNYSIHPFTLFYVSQGPVDGKSVKQAGLRGMTGIFLAFVDCADGTPLDAVHPDTVLHVSV